MNFQEYLIQVKDFFQLLLVPLLGAFLLVLLSLEQLLQQLQRLKVQIALLALKIEKLLKKAEVETENTSLIKSTKELNRGVGKSWAKKPMESVIKENQNRQVKAKEE
jgi:hypothetical protein